MWTESHEPPKLDWVRRLQDLGKIEIMLSQILEDDIFDNLSKHDPYWDSENDDEADRLHDCRMKFAFIQDKISECWSLAKGDY